MGFLQVQETLGRDPVYGDLFVFRGARGDLVKISWHEARAVALRQQRWNAAGLFGHRR
ncbi:MAG: IS66 family insertion sequence element accessory protein TnpB [Hyphomicrobiaceae bacterium]